MCDRIGEDDERQKQFRDMKCVDINKKLEICLNSNDRDFRKCKNELNDLKICMNMNKGNMIENNKISDIN